MAKRKMAIRQKQWSTMVTLEWMLSGN